jgi:hypothetical protein
MSDFPHLHTLNLEAHVIYREIHLPNYPFNATIKNVKCNMSKSEVRRFGYGQLIIPFIQKLQNLQAIKLGYINSAILHALFNSRTLRTVKYYDLDVTELDLEEMELHENIDFIEMHWPTH